MANAAALKTAGSTSEGEVSLAARQTRFAWAMLSDSGRVRHANQDACAAAPEHAAFVVCDGVGGAAGGEIASRLAAETFLAAIKQSGVERQSFGGVANADEDSSYHPAARLQQAVVAANAVIFERARKNRSLRGMATTLVAALLEYGGADVAEGCPTLWLAHAGDSRAYVLRAGAAELTQLTRDHSLIEEQIRAGLLNPLDAGRSPVRNVITRAVGAMPAVEPEIASHAIEPGDLYLLASDGLTRELEDEAIARILVKILGEALNGDSGRSSEVLQAAARALIDAANAHGGRDNITVLLIACR